MPGLPHDVNHDDQQRGREAAMTRRHMIRTASVGAICALAGATTGIAGGSAKVAHRGTAKTRWGQFIGHDPHDAHGIGPVGLVGRGWDGLGAIHSVSIEPGSAGSFDTVTNDSGTITAVGAGALTMKEGSSSATYATPTITPAGKVTVVLDWKTSTFSALAVGDRVWVMQRSAGTTTIVATDSAAKSAQRSGWPGGWTGTKFPMGDYSSADG